MIIKCSECGLQISDKAIFCPHCGFPLQPNKITNVKRRKKLPNGFGQITKLKNKALKKPYRAMITDGKTDAGKPIQKLLRPVAYFSTYEEAYEALIANAKDPYDVNKDMTLEQLYNEWSEEKYKTITYSTYSQYKLGWSYCAKYKSYRVIDIKAKEVKAIVLNPDVSVPIQRIIRILMNNLFDYALELEIVDRNYSRQTKVSIDGSYESKHHITFSKEEISILWQNKKNLYVKWILVQCYTGMRPNELCTMLVENINLDENYMIGGLKTKAGKNRIIPIHNAIRPIVEELVDYANLCESEYLLNTANKGHGTYKVYKVAFQNIMKEFSLSDGHTPHDCRKFFVTEAKRANLDEYAIKRIVGHTITDLTESVYTERDLSWLLEEVNKISVYE